MTSIKSLAFIFFVLFSLSLKGQNSSPEKFQGTLAQILSQLESKTGMHFYYRSDMLPEGSMELVLDTQTPEESLKKNLSALNLGLLHYQNNNYVIMPVSEIGQVYSASYYQALEKSREIQTSEETSQDDIVVGDLRSVNATGKATVEGIIYDDHKNPVIGATIAFTDLETGTVTDENGNFAIELPVGTHDILVKYIGFDDLFTKIVVYNDGKLILNLREEAVDLEAVTVTAQAADASVSNVQIGVTAIDVKNIKKIPALLGEADVVRSLLLNPGVSSVGEGAIGFNVRGGNVDQNLVRQDEGFFFNSSHALGFFSTYNPDLISTVDLFKGNMPAQFGGRLASVLDVQMKNGDFQSFKLKGGAGPVTSRLSMEGPIVRDKISFIAGGRSSYSDWILKQVKILEVQQSSSFFYDANFRLAIKPSDKSSVILSAYRSLDDFTYNNEFGYDYATDMLQMIYRQIFNDKWYHNFSAAYSKYESSQTDLLGLDAAVVSNDIQYFKIQEHLTFTPTRNNKIDMGLGSVMYLTDPALQEPYGEESDIIASQTERDKGLESFIFANTEFEINPSLLISAGLRGVFYQYLGPNTLYEYANPEAPLSEEITGTSSIPQGEKIVGYHSIEPRFSLRYRFSEPSSVKVGYSRTAQFINQIFNTDSPTPNSQWQLSTNYIKPYRAHNVSAGYFRNFNANIWETSLEVYGRFMDQIYDYRDFANLIVNNHIETELLPGIGRSYGAELSIKKKTGILNGWISYTYSRSERKIDGINNSDWYPSNFDKTHDGSIILNYQPNRRNTLTINFNYNTGRPTTPPIGNFKLQNDLVVPIYSQRNQYRIPDYHRLDIAYTLGKGYKRDRRAQTSWTFSVYNVYARKNAFSVFFTQGAFRRTQANRLAILGSAIPSVTFNLEII